MPSGVYPRKPRPAQNPAPPHFSLHHLSAAQLRHAADIQEQIETAKNELDRVLKGQYTVRSSENVRRMPSELKGLSLKVGNPRRPMPESVKLKIAAGARARWAKAKAAGKNSL